MAITAEPWRRTIASAASSRSLSPCSRPPAIATSFSPILHRFTPGRDGSPANCGSSSAAVGRLNYYDRQLGAREDVPRSASEQMRPQPRDAVGADHDRRPVARDGKVDQRVGHVHLVGDRMGLGIQPERAGEASAVLRDGRGVLLARPWRPRP